MRSGTKYTITSDQVYSECQQRLLSSKLVKDRGWLCTAALVVGIVLRAAARSISLSAACRDLSEAPSDQAAMTAVKDGLPRTLAVLERRLNETLTSPLPRCLQRRSWQVAIDLHLDPYYGQPQKSRNEIYYGAEKAGTKRFHAYATACIIQYGYRYTLALTWVRRHETLVQVLRRLLAQIREIGLKIKRVLLDRAFFTVAVMAFLQKQKLPFLMPVMFRGRKPKRGRPVTGLRRLKQQPAGWYPYTMKSNGQEVAFSICVGYRRYKNRKTGKRGRQKLLFAAWRIHGSPTEIRERYRKRFGIESSYRQIRQARICTCTRDPHRRLFFVAVALLLRNIWVWFHHIRLSESCGNGLHLRLDLLRFKRMLDWIIYEVMHLYHDGTAPYVVRPP
jgi:hypothetical protein